MLNIRIICVGRLKERFYIDAANEYIKRLSGYCKLDVVEISEYRVASGGGMVGVVVSDHQRVVGCGQETRGTKGLCAQVGIALDKERVAIEGKVPAGALTVALCVEGREMDSLGLSDFLADQALRGVSKLCFIIGGSHGLHDDVKNGADIRLSMSKMTFPHNLARVMLLEQLYRAFKITEGGKYHK